MLKFIYLTCVTFSMFSDAIPAFTGTLLTSSPGVINKSEISIEYNLYSKKSSHNTNIRYITSAIDISYGITSGCECDFYIPCKRNGDGTRVYTNIGDISLNFDFSLRDFFYIPTDSSISLGIVFPTGNYQSLANKDAFIEVTGSGQFQITQSFQMGGIYTTNVGSALRYSLDTGAYYAFPRLIRGEGIYGIVNGTLSHNYGIYSSIGFEYELTQKLAFAFDVHSALNSPLSALENNESIHINPIGFAIVIAPAMEYMVSKNAGLIGGVSFTILSKNMRKYTEYMCSLSYTF